MAASIPLFQGPSFSVRRSAQDEKAGDPKATPASEAGEVLTHESNNTGLIELCSVPGESACSE